MIHFARDWKVYTDLALRNQDRESQKLKGLIFFRLYCNAEWIKWKKEKFPLTMSFFSIAIEKVEVTWERIKKKQSVCNKAELKTDTMLKQPKKKSVHFLI